jgi:hypothetical protein
VSWTKTVDDAKSAVASKSEPFAIYFVAPDLENVIGAGSKAAADYKFANKGKNVPQNIWDNPTASDAMKKAGINTFVKIAVTKENMEVCKKYGAGPNTLVICTPDGDKLSIFAGPQCTQCAVTSAMKTFKLQFEAFMKTKAAQEARKVASAKPAKPDEVVSTTTK